MTLSRLLRDYVYFPLGGNRRGPWRRHINLFATMALGGLWHGAGWTFVAWGMLHGAYLVINHMWHSIRRALFGPIPSLPTMAGRILGICMTFMAVVIGWVLFRADSFTSAVGILSAMAGQNGVTLPSAIFAHVPNFGNIAVSLGIEAMPGGGREFIATWTWIIAAGAIAFFMPNTQQMMRDFEPALNFVIDGATAAPAKFVWRPTRGMAVLTAVVLVAGLFGMARVSEFLYFQF